MVTIGRRTQLALVGVMAAVVLGVFVVGPAIYARLFPPAADPVSKAPDGTFAATDPEWRTLRFAQAQAVTIGDRAASDGRIAVDDNLTTPVFSPFTGHVTSIAVHVGDRVSAGQVLFTVAATEAAQSDADIAAAAAQVKLAKAAEARLHDLYDHHGAALKDWQQAQADLVTAEAGLAAAQGRRKALGGSVDHGVGVVRAPIAGVVTQRLIGEGQNVASAASGGATQAMVISRFDKVWLVGNLREEDAARARVGMIAQVRPLTGDTVLQARVTYVAPAIDPVTRRLTVRAELANPDGLLKPETFASFTLLTGTGHTALTVPEDAVIFEAQTARVWVVTDATAHRLALRPITTGHVANGEVEVTGGLRAGETVVTAGSLFIDRGAKAD